MTDPESPTPPPTPDGDELSDEDLSKVAGGTGVLLQNNLESESRLHTTLSNIMSKTSTTAGNIVDNLK
jgi:hypothetical protein